MNVVITAMGLGTSASPCEYAIERTIRRCIDDGMLGEVPTQQLDVEVSFDDAESGGIPEAFKSEFAEDHETALDRRVQEAFDEVVAKATSLDNDHLFRLACEVDNYDTGTLEDNLQLLRDAGDVWVDGGYMGDMLMHRVVSTLARDVWQKKLYAKLAATLWAGLDHATVQMSITEAITDTGGECLEDTRITSICGHRLRHQWSEDQIDVSYEHGGWFVTHMESGAQWSCHEWTTTETDLGVARWGFERVSEGEFA